MRGSIFPRPSTRDPRTGKRRPVKGSTWTWQINGVIKAGKRTTPSKGGFRTREEAEDALAVALAEYGQGGPVRIEPSKMALSSYLTDEWLPTLHGLKSTTKKSYEWLVDRYIEPALGDVRLCDLTAGQLAKLYEAMRTSGRLRVKEGGPTGVSESTIHHVHVALSASLGHAVEAGFLRVSPVTQLPKKARPTPSSKQRPEIHPWTAEQARAFLAFAATDRLGPLFDLALNTGLRRGELVGLRWEDVDLDAGQLAVRRNRVMVGYSVEEGTPKTNKPRMIDLDEGTVTAIRAHRRRQLEERMKWGEAWDDTGLVFTREDGTALHPQTVTWHLRRLVKAANKVIVKEHGDKEGAPALVPTIRLHDLRHTHATLGLAAGVPAKVMQERLGHSSIQITLDLYSHVVPGMQADAAAKIGALLRQA